MKTIAPHFLNISAQGHHFIAKNPEEKEMPVQSEYRDKPYCSEKKFLDEKTIDFYIDDFLLKNQEAGKCFYGSARTRPAKTLRQRAFDDLRERLDDYIDKKQKAGIKLSDEWVSDIAKQMTETVCRVLYLETLTYTDPLTGLPNRRAFDTRLKEEILRSGKNIPLCMIIFDLDQFKQVNDIHGHLAGDSVLKEVARCFRAEDESKRILRDSDFVARYGGDELVLLLPDTDSEGGCIVASRISDAIKGSRFELGKNGATRSISLSASIGVSEYEGNEKDPDGSDMINNADDCLYIMKGEKPDADGVQRERRGQIACNGRIVRKDEIWKSMLKNPHLTLPIDAIQSVREELEKQLTEHFN